MAESSAATSREAALARALYHAKARNERYSRILTGPSFFREIRGLRERDRIALEQGRSAQGPSKDLTSKLGNYELALSHGIPCAEVLAVWPEVRSMDLSGLHGKFVVKADGGASGGGVLLLERVGVDSFRVVGEDTVFGESGVKEFFSDAFARNVAWGRIFAERFIQSETAEIPLDVKVYTCFGEIIQILGRSVSRLRDESAVDRAYFDANGTNLGQVLGMAKTNDALRLPADDLSVLQGFCEHLSSATGRPFVRLDFYFSKGAWILGEITPSPGGEQNYKRAHDVTMGEAWVRAENRLAKALAEGRPYGVLFGSHSHPDFRRPGGWTRGEEGVISGGSLCPYCKGSSALR